MLFVIVVTVVDLRLVLLHVYVRTVQKILTLFDHPAQNELVAVRWDDSHS